MEEMCIFVTLKRLQSVYFILLAPCFHLDGQWFLKSELFFKNDLADAQYVPVFHDGSTDWVKCNWVNSLYIALKQSNWLLVRQPDNTEPLASPSLRVSRKLDDQIRLM